LIPPRSTLVDTLQAQVKTAGMQAPSLMHDRLPAPQTTTALSPCLSQRMAALLLLLCPLFVAAGCTTDDRPALPPPLAGVQHAEVVRVGAPVTFDAQPSRSGALFNAEGVVVEQAAIVKYRFLAADGSATEEVASPDWQHTFTHPGIYAISLTIVDDLGRDSTVRSYVHVTADYTPTCTSASSVDCDSGRCLGDVCSRVACADQAVCPVGTTCAQGYCYVTPPAAPSGDLLTAADAGATGIDAADRSVP